MCCKEGAAHDPHKNVHHNHQINFIQIKLFKITFSSPEPDKSVNSQNYIPLIQQISIIRPVRVHHANCDIVRGTRLMDTLDLSV